jgi:putative sterol carrier protein
MPMSQVPQDLTPEQFVEMVKGATDEQIVETVHQAGTKEVLDRTFHGMQEAFDPSKAQGMEAVVQWVVTDDGQEHPYALKISGGACILEPGMADSPKTTLTTDLVSYLRIIAGQAQGPSLFMTGKLKVAGDLMFAQQVSALFRPPA